MWGATLPGVFQFLDDDDAGAFAHDEAVPFLVKGPRGAFRIAIARAQRPHGGKTAHAQGDAGRFTAAGQDDLRLVVADEPPGLANAVVGCRAGRHDAEIGPGKAELHGDQARGHVADHHRNHEGRDAARAFQDQLLVLLAERFQSPDAGADQHPHAIEVQVLRVEPAVLHRFLGGGHGQLRIAIRPARVLLVEEMGAGFEILHPARRSGNRTWRRPMR